jgi:hypothetical protein
VVVEESHWAIGGQTQLGFGVLVVQMVGEAEFMAQDTIRWEVDPEFAILMIQSHNDRGATDIGQLEPICIRMRSGLDTRDDSLIHEQILSKRRGSQHYCGSLGDVNKRPEGDVDGGALS